MIWQQLTQPQQDQFLEYGAIGLLALLSVFAVFKLFDRLSKSYERELEREKQRADRLETDLREQNKILQERIMISLGHTADILKEILDEQRRK